MIAGDDRGTWFVPEIDDEVLVGFGGGDPDRPYVVGALWNGKDAAPETIDATTTSARSSPARDIRITLDDTDGAVTLTLSTPGGRKVTLRRRRQQRAGRGRQRQLAGAGAERDHAHRRQQAQHQRPHDPDRLRVRDTVNVADVDLLGRGQVHTIIATTVVGSSYTPGAGNVW